MNTCTELTHWKEALAELETFTAEHLDIVATTQSLVVPESLRATFYHLVAQAQNMLCAEVLGTSAEETIIAARRCARVKRRLVEMSDLIDFRLASALETLISDPQAALAKPLFGMVLDVVQGRSSVNQLLSDAQLVLPEHSKTLFRNAYEAWAYYGVVAALQPVRFFEVYSPDTVKTQAVSTGRVIVGSQITSPERRIPEAVFEAADGRFFAMKSEVARELDYYGSKITRRRDYSSGGNTADQIAHRVLLLYQIPNAEHVPIIADRDKQMVLACDLMCEVLSAQEIEQPSYVSQFVNRIATVRSQHPVQVLCFDDSGTFDPEMLEDERIPDIDRRTLGFSEEVLVDIAGLLQ